VAYKYRLHEDAQQELNEILRWYINNGGIDVADRFVVKLNTVVEILEDFPNIRAAV
jgi:plasmid stabilization system protein ParE